MARVLIGSYILDSADSGSTSTTTGVQLLLDYNEPLSPRFSNDEYQWPTYYAKVVAASESALATACDAVEAAIVNCSGLTIIYEETASTTLFQMHPNIWPNAEGAVEKEMGQLTALIAFTFIGRRAGPTSSGAADEPGLKSPITYEYVMSPGGIAGMVAQAVFGPTLSGTTVTAGSRQNAVAWINKLRNTANYPPWLSTAFRMAGPTIEFERKQNVATEAESAYDPARVTIPFVELPATLAADGTFPSTCVKANFNVALNEREALNERAQALPGFDITLHGDLTFKTEGNTTFDSSDSSLADNAIYTAALAAVNSIITMFNSMYSTFGLIQWGKPVISINEPDGLVTFAVRFTGDVTVFEWDEETKLRSVYPKSHTRASDGSEFKYVMKGGPIRTCHHRLRIVATNPKGYKPPPLSNDWDELEIGADATIKRVFNNGMAQYVTEGESLWRYVNPGPSGGGAQRSSAGILVDFNAIGKGIS